MVSSGQDPTTSTGPASAAAPSPAKRDDTAPGRRRRHLIGVSTKMYFSAARTGSFTQKVIELLSSTTTLTLDDIDIFIIPDFVTLTSVIAAVRSAPEGSVASRILIGAQDCYSEDFGAFTGEVSPAVLREVGVRFVELGHAERKRLFGETDGRVGEKVRAVVRNGMVPVVCVGELTEGEVAEAVREVIKQVQVVLEGVGELEEVVLAYEPVWAIGAGEPAGVEYVKQVARGIREWEGVKKRGEKVRIIYGGAAGRGLWDKFGGEVDGLFLGRFGHDGGEFVKMVGEVGGGWW
ncbi:putative Triosephosphate isomerase [Triangularia setosa]|uniref:Triosephosphate isomerase n=1 Tax=Triangularia setosa TaxID=2587417 RepID=A0AAN6W2R2_9PEZI|nr:putative Triosephosphate isomerase [Podospora setosa]